MSAPQQERPGTYVFGASMASIFALFGYSWREPFVLWLAGGLFTLFAVLGANLALERWRVEQAIQATINAPGLFGNAGFATLDELADAGLAGQQSATGLFLGAVHGEMVFYEPESHLLTIAPNGTGKTSGIGVPNLLATAAIAPLRGMFVTDKSGESAAMCWRFVNDKLPDSVCMNAAGLHGLPNHRLNRLQSIVDLARSGSPDCVDAARDKLLIIVQEPDASGDNKHFRDSARDLGTWVLVYLAFEHSELCTLPDFNDAINGGEEELLRLFAAMQLSDAAAGQVARAGKRFLSMMQNAEKQFQGVISELHEALSIWDAYSTLGRSCRHSDFNPSIIKDGPAVVFLVIPEDKAEVWSKDAALVVDEFVKACMRHPNKEPHVVFLMDEFQRLPVMKCIPTALYRGRGSGLIVWPIIQDGKSLKAYGKDESAFRTQAEVVQMFGVRDVADAAYLETRIGQTTLYTESLSRPQGEGAQAQYSLQYGQQGAPYMRKDEVLQVPAGKQFIVYKSMPVIVGDVVPWWLVSPWNEWPDPNPKEGPKPAVAPSYFLAYEED